MGFPHAPFLEHIYGTGSYVGTKTTFWKAGGGRVCQLSRTCISKPVEAPSSSLGDLSVGGGRVSAAGIAGRGRDVHLRLTHVEETHVQLEVAAPTGLGHVGTEHGLWGETVGPMAEGSWRGWSQVR